MRDLQKTFVGLFTFALFALPFAAAAASVSVQNLTPGASVTAKSNIWFNIVPNGFSSAVYHISDSFPNSSASLSNIDPGGKFSWTPVAYDAGTHIFTISITDNDGNSASVAQTITVLPPPSIKITNVSPGASFMPGTKLTFTVVADGFTNPRFMVGDTFGSPSISNENINSSGQFTWTPDMSQNGEHTINVYATDSLGHSSSASVVVRVGAGPSIAIGSVSPVGNINPGQTVSFAVSATNYSPTAFSVADSLPGTSLSNNNINLSGMFSWTPSASDAGVHTVVITGQVGAYGAAASTTQKITVLGPNGQLPAAAQVPISTSSAATSTSNLALAALQAQLAFLQSKMVGQTGALAIQSPAAASYIFTLYLKPGSTGDEVRKLQDFMKERGYLTAAPNGFYGVGTTEAVKKFQTEHGLDALGLFGPATRAIVNGLLAGVAVSSPVTAGTPTPVSTRYIFEHFMGVGDDDPDVLELQKRLVSLGYLTSAPTGYYGSVTEAAVKKFQAALSISQTGWVSRETRQALNK